MKRKPVVGETLFDLNVGNAARWREQKLTPVKVTAVGRKYFKCKPEGASDYLEKEYHIDTWRQKTEYSANHQLYETEQEYIDDRDTNQIAFELRTLFSSCGKCKIPVATLRQIKALIQESSETTEPTL